MYHKVAIKKKMASVCHLECFFSLNLVTHLGLCTPTYRANILDVLLARGAYLPSTRRLLRGALTRTRKDKIIEELILR